MRNLEDSIGSLEKRTEALFHKDVPVYQVGRLNIEATRLWLSHQVSGLLNLPAEMEGYPTLAATEFIADFPSSLLHRLEVVISTLEAAFLPFNSDEKVLMKKDMVRMNGWRDYTKDSCDFTSKKMLEDFKAAQNADGIAHGNWM